MECINDRDVGIKELQYNFTAAGAVRMQRLSALRHMAQMEDC
jgi:hypothetical protein